MCIHAQHLAFIHTGARRRAGRIGAANLNAGADGGAARRRNDFENHDGNEIDDNHLRYEQPRCRQRKRKPQTRRQPSINPLFVRSSTSNYAKPPTNKPRRTNRKTQARKRSKRIRHRRTCVGSASLQSAQLSSWDVFSYSVLSVENKFISLYRCRFTASCVVRVLLRRPRIFAKVVKLLSNIFHLDSQFTEYRVYTLDKYKVS